MPLRLAGPEADREKVKTCIEEGRAAGLRVTHRVANPGLLILSSAGNRLRCPNGNERPLGK